MQIFFAGPLVSTCPPLRRNANDLFCLSGQSPATDHSHPDRDQSREHAQHDIQRSGQHGAFTERHHRLISESRKRGIAADKPNGDEVAPAGIQVRTVGKNGHDESDGKTAGTVYDECSIRKAGTEARIDGAAQPEAGDGPEEASDARHEVAHERAAHRADFPGRAWLRIRRTMALISPTVFSRCFPPAGETSP